MELSRLLGASLAFLLFCPATPYAAELDPNPSWHTLNSSKPSQESPKAKDKVHKVEATVDIKSKHLAPSNSSILARLIAQTIVPIEIGVWSANSSFLIGLYGTVDLLVEHDPSFHVKNRQADTEKFPDSMKGPLLSSKSDIGFDVQRTILNQKLHFMQMEGAI